MGTERVQTKPSKERVKKLKECKVKGCRNWVRQSTPQPHEYYQCKKIKIFGVIIMFYKIKNDLLDECNDCLLDRQQEARYD